MLKGEYAGSTLELRFLGGTVGTARLEVTDMLVPQVAERGIYFVESLSAPQVNPLVGWSQGHFLIEPQAGLLFLRTVAIVAFGDEHRTDLPLEKIAPFGGEVRAREHRP